MAATKAEHPPAYTPEQLQSVRSTLMSPRRLKTEVLAGLVVALALIPEAIAFSIIAGVDPRLGLFASFTMAVTIAFVGGRPAMISAATGAIALVIAPLVKSHGVDYFIAAVVLAGVFQIILGLSGVAKLMRFIPRSVMVGFVNALAILIFMSQVPELLGVPWLVYPLVILGLAIVFGLPKLTKAVPAPLVAIVVLTLITVFASVAVPTVGDKGELPESLPMLFIPNVPFTFETFQVLFPFALAMAFVGLLESLMTAKLVDDVTDTRSNKTREAWGQGVANIVTGFTGGMGGCAMIGQTMINVKASGARTRISTFLAGIFLLILVVVLGDVVSVIPMAALVAVMIFVSVATFDWHSIRPGTLKMMPKSETTVMLATVVVTVATHNLAIGVGVGVLVAMVMFARRVAHFVTVERTVKAVDGRETATYVVDGELFFASSNDLYTQFEYAHDPAHVVIDMHASHLWDASTIAALDAITEKYHAHGTDVKIVGLNDASLLMQERLGGKLGAGH
ncbi:SulP family inorganic anion transporter [Paenarthrobacter ureafaciens]|uniref:SulP family inorganic anion transporter n=1 Tax=Paenarthrobacter ureafaciens TaxID=37931 RepID=UPI0009ADBFBC|nr:SulP family inorganic anion transporter [Paenarthrobacter ureafaciens]GLU60949.1 sodium-independent anion transporter [Paenarthrobacter ureafaciens]GLU65219.1 sodium-independent anion transporter [Paenarthrobacter ureafaciens]GLU69348.1 sodium-independent anion transporter [Paenarthrobacter ureafaciens]GLU73649.1 sodium-independent anion transporter [Paenarthrobacter ureafaciens]GLU78020.1 sodium-independent anion transporter [Paenarthrobacter ureafaciens]